MTTITARAQPFHSSRGQYAALATGLGVWFLAALGLGLEGTFSSNPGNSPLAMPFAILTPILVFALAYASWRGFREFILALDTRVLVLLHTWRMVGLGFLFLYVFDVLPGILAFPAGLGDAAAAVWALVVGVGLYGGFRVSRRQLLAWNTFGLIDFVIAVLIGTLARPGPLHLIPGEITTAAMGVFPLYLIPTFIVPLLVITHLIIYAQIRHRGIASVE